MSGQVLSCLVEPWADCFRSQETARLQSALTPSEIRSRISFGRRHHISGGCLAKSLIIMITCNVMMRWYAKYYSVHAIVGVAMYLGLLLWPATVALADILMEDYHLVLLCLYAATFLWLPFPIEVPRLAANA